MVATIHDLIHLKFKGQLPSGLAAVYARAMFRAAGRRCRRLIAISECTQRDLIQLAGVRPDRIAVIPYGRDERFQEGSDPQTFPIPGVSPGEPVLLSVGNLKPHKNVEILLEALALPGPAPAFKLVIAGGDEAGQERLRQSARSLGVGDRVLWIGPVEHERIPELYRRATALLFPSLYEGFGLPPLEAMASGVPVLASTAASIPEVVGDAALCLSPTDARAWREAMERIVLDPGLRQDLVERGRERAKAFSWEKAARETLEVYHHVARRTGP
jgi:glycosyltransferase involved in cell wall biosynthesis